MTDKTNEAVANPVRDGSAKGAKAAYERMMAEIFAESRRVLKDNGIMTIMFTHKSQDAWETLTRALIETGWNITAAFPVESEGTEGKGRFASARPLMESFPIIRSQLELSQVSLRY